LVINIESIHDARSEKHQVVISVFLTEVNVKVNIDELIVTGDYLTL